MKTENFEKLLIAKAEGKYTGLPVSYFTDRIVWLWKWKKINKETLSYYTDIALFIMGQLEEFPIKNKEKTK